MNKLIIDLCQRVVNDRRLNTRDFNYCDGINCDRDNCPFVIGTKCNITEPIGIEIAKQYLKDNGIKENNKTEELSEDERDFALEIVNECLKEKNKIEKTFKEVIADIKEGEVWENSLRRIELLNGDIQISRINGKEFNTHILQFSKSITYKLKRNKYNFNEAFKAYEEGEEIESCENGYKYLQNTFTYPGNEQWLCFRNSEQMFTTDAIRGKWYIND